jgi:hypothetical protein
VHRFRDQGVLRVATYNSDFDIVVGTVFPVLLVATGLVAQFARETIGRQIGKSRVTGEGSSFLRINGYLSLATCLLVPITSAIGTYIAAQGVLDQKQSHSTQEYLLDLLELSLVLLTVQSISLIANAYYIGSFEAYDETTEAKRKRELPPTTPTGRS